MDIQQQIKKLVLEDKLPVTYGLLHFEYKYEPEKGKESIEQFYRQNFDQVLGFFKVLYLDQTNDVLNQKILSESELQDLSNNSSMTLLGISLLGIINKEADVSQIDSILLNNETIKQNQNIEQLEFQIRKLNLEQKIQDASNTDNLKKRNLNQQQQQQGNLKQNTQKDQKQIITLKQPISNTNQLKPSNTSSNGNQTKTNPFFKPQQQPQQQPSVAVSKPQDVNQGTQKMLKKKRQIKDSDDESDEDQPQQSNKMEIENKENNENQSDGECQFLSTIPEKPQQKVAPPAVPQNQQKQQQQKPQPPKPAPTTTGNQSKKQKGGQQPNIMSFFKKK